MRKRRIDCIKVLRFSVTTAFSLGSKMGLAQWRTNLGLSISFMNDCLLLRFGVGLLQKFLILSNYLWRLLLYTTTTLMSRLRIQRAYDITSMKDFFQTVFVTRPWPGPQGPYYDNFFKFALLLISFQFE